MDKNQELDKLEEFLTTTKDIKEWKRAQTVKLRLLGNSYQSIANNLGVSYRFIAKISAKYLKQGLEGLKLAYKGSKPFLTPEQKQEVKQWLEPLERRNISELERHLIEKYNVSFKSKQSYYSILRESKLTWQKANKENSRKDEEKIRIRNKELQEILEFVKPEVESGKLVVYALDECHLQGDDICSYLWGDKEKRETIKIENERDRQTYYGALNIKTKEFIILPYNSGNGENTVAFVNELKKRHPQEKLMLIWDGASYHRGEKMRELLSDYNKNLPKEEWIIICERFASYAPEENPVEGIWLQGKNFLRRFYYLCKNFKIVKRLFEFFFDLKLYNSPNLENYDVFAQFI